MNLRGPMTGSELMSARARLDWTVAQLAYELLEDESRVREWEAGTRPVPRLTARKVRWHLAHRERAQAMAASGLPECAWIQKWEEEFEPSDDMEEDVKQMEAFQKHGKECRTCLDRAAYLAQRFAPLPPYPMGGGWTILAGIVDQFEKLPSWARPIAGGAAALGGIVLLRIVFTLPRALRDPAGALAALLAATAAGGAGGAVYVLTRPPLRRLGRFGNYLSAIAAVAGYLSALAFVAPIAFGEPLLHDGSDWIIVAGVSIVLGLAIGAGVGTKNPK